MHFEGEIRVPGKAADVIRRFADVPRMASCMPGAVLEPQAEDGSWPGAMVVSFGPKKVIFKGKATCDFDNDALTGVFARVHGKLLGLAQTTLQEIAAQLDRGLERWEELQPLWSG